MASIILYDVCRCRSKTASHKLSMSSANKQVCIYQHIHASKHKQVGLFHLLHLLSEEVVYTTFKK